MIELFWETRIAWDVESIGKILEKLKIKSYNKFNFKKMKYNCIETSTIYMKKL